MRVTSGCSRHDARARRTAVENLTNPTVVYVAKCGGNLQSSSHFQRELSEVVLVERTMRLSCAAQRKHRCHMYAERSSLDQAVQSFVKPGRRTPVVALNIEAASATRLGPDTVRVRDSRTIA